MGLSNEATSYKKVFYTVFSGAQQSNSETKGGNGKVIHFIQREISLPEEYLIWQISACE